jgi:hypothetical protein
MLHLKPQPKKEIKPMKELFKVFAGLGAVGAVIAFFILIVLWPLVIVWALNTLFGLGITYTFWNWLAALVLMLAIKARVTTKKE